ncbi:hypothetical protein TRVL_08823 [Trypanosoma vivax]|nr:hypothetical protein TRVL_08823 [Trypanosoma vivax]
MISCFSSAFFLPSLHFSSCMREFFPHPRCPFALFVPERARSPDFSDVEKYKRFFPPEPCCGRQLHFPIGFLTRAVSLSTTTTGSAVPPCSLLTLPKKSVFGLSFRARGTLRQLALPLSALASLLAACRALSTWLPFPFYVIFSARRPSGDPMMPSLDPIITCCFRVSRSLPAVSLLFLFPTTVLFLSSARLFSGSVPPLLPFCAPSEAFPLVHLFAPGARVEAACATCLIPGKAMHSAVPPCSPPKAFSPFLLRH